MASVKIIPAIEKQARILRVAAYCRVSSDSADQLHSYAAQIRYYTEFIARHEGWELIDVYADEGLTGTRTDIREDFNRMLRDCRNEKIDRILVKSVSRFARNSRDCLTVLRELASLGVSVCFEKENIDTSTLTTELMVSVYSALAQEESVSVSQNQRMSYQRRMEKGEYITNCAPYGYRIQNGKTLKIYEPEAAVIREIFERYLSGISTADIARTLTERGVPAKNGGRVWQISGINYILRNEKYMGDALCRKTMTAELMPFTRRRNEGEQEQYYVGNSHPAIIPREMFERTRKLMDARASVISGGHAVYPLTKKMVCAKCGATFIRRKSVSGQVKWACLTHTKNASACANGPVSEDAVYQAFIRMYNKLRRYGEIVFRPALDQMDAWNDTLQRNNPAMLAIHREMAETSERHYRIAKLHAEGRLDADMCAVKLRETEIRLTELRRKRRQAQSGEQADEATDRLRRIMKIIRDGPEHPDAFDEELFRSLTESAVVESQTEIRFRLFGGVELAAALREAES